MSSGKRPDRTTMEGMIWNANHVLDQALSPDTPGVSLSFCHIFLPSHVNIMISSYIFHSSIAIHTSNNRYSSWYDQKLQGYHPSLRSRSRIYLFRQCRYWYVHKLWLVVPNDDMRPHNRSKYFIVRSFFLKESSLRTSTMVLGVLPLHWGLVV